MASPTHSGAVAYPQLRRPVHRWQLIDTGADTHEPTLHLLK
jgi:hypothetical protein